MKKGKIEKIKCFKCWYIWHDGCKWIDKDIPNEPWDADKNKSGYFIRDCHQFRPEEKHSGPYDQVGIENLAQAVVSQGMRDYMSMLRKEKKTGHESNRKKDLENFMNSQWFIDLSDMDGKRAMQIIKDAVTKEPVKKDDAV